jgi:isoquinoline 1-oxidoreductase beta subunit
MPRPQALAAECRGKAGWANRHHKVFADWRRWRSTARAACAEISVSGGNKVKIHRIVCATDPGYAVNPAQIERQIAGSFVYGLSAVFDQECTVKNGRIEQTNFNTYNSMRIAQMPKVEAIVMPSGGFWGGVGEPTICVAAPAVLNAYFAATGKRIRSFPLKNHGITLV